MNLPGVSRDPRFRAARRLLEQGKFQAAAGTPSAIGPIEIFAALLEEARERHGVDHIESAAAYYEYGNSLFRWAVRQQQQEQLDEEAANEEDDSQRKPAALSEKDEAEKLQRNAAAQAAERRAAAALAEPSDISEKQPARAQDGSNESKSTSAAATASVTLKNENDNDSGDSPGDAHNDDSDDGADDDDDDMHLALEMMETAWSILDQYCNTTAEEQQKYRGWATQQLPRILTGIGDVLSTVERHADAADAYLRALKYRMEELGKLTSDKAAISSNGENQTSQLALLVCRRKVVENNVLIAEELLACAPEKDVVTTESHDCLVKAAERIDFARGYYDRARDELQETVLLMGELAAAGVDVGQEKEDVCFAATMVMAIGNTLAEIDEEQQIEDSKPASKKQKTA